MAKLDNAQVMHVKWLLTVTVLLGPEILLHALTFECAGLITRDLTKIC